jgi:hypothetical protein
MSKTHAYVILWLRRNVLFPIPRQLEVGIMPDRDVSELWVVQTMGDITSEAVLLIRHRCTERSPLYLLI